MEVIVHELAAKGEIKQINLINDEIASVLLNEILMNNRDIYTFLQTESLSLATSAEVLRSINKIRLYKVSEEYVGNNLGKIAQLKKLIGDYETSLISKNRYDYALLLSNAIEILKKGGYAGGFSYGLLRDSSYTWLELKFISMLTGGKFNIVSYNEKKDINCTPFKGYGILNEISYVTDRIEKDKLPLGSVNLFYTNDSYENFIRSAFESKEIPCRFVTGCSALTTNIVCFMCGILSWAESDFLYSSLKNVMSNPVIHIEGVKSPYYYYTKYIKTELIWGLSRYKSFAQAKLMEIANELQENESKEGSINADSAFLNFLENAAAVFEDYDQDKNIAALYKNLLDFTIKYTYKKNKEKKLVLNKLEAEADILGLMNYNFSFQEAVAFIKERLEGIVVGEDESASAVNIIKLNGTEIIERKYNFVIGLSASQFNSAVVESPVLSDSELKKYVKGNRQLSTHINRKKERALLNILRTADVDSEIFVGCNTYDTINMRMASPSNIYLRLAGKTDVDAIETRVYGDIIDSNIKTESLDEIWSRFTQNNDSTEKEDEIKEESNSLSASKIKDILDCPLQYYYKDVRGIRDADFYERNSARWLNAPDKGNFTHKVLEEYIKKEFVEDKSTSASINEELFKRIFEEVADEYVLKCPYDSKEVFSKEKGEIEGVVRAYLEKLHTEVSEDGWKVEGCEVGFEDVKYVLEDDERSRTLLFKGFIDRVDVNSENNVRIIDYKTGKTKNENYQQHIIYSLGYENAETFVYDYLFLGSQVKKSVENADFDEKVKEILLQTLLKREYSGKSAKEKTCDYCSYTDICREKWGENNDLQKPE